MSIHNKPDEEAKETKRKPDYARGLDEDGATGDAQPDFARGLRKKEEDDTSPDYARGLRDKTKDEEVTPDYARTEEAD